jgi:hypothetical protein
MRWTVVPVLLLAAAASAGDLSDLDAQNGFLNSHFGDRREQAQGLSEVNDFGAIRLFVRTQDRKSFRGANFRAVGYLYYGDQLFAIVLVPRTSADEESLLETFRVMYGDPYEGSSVPQWWGRHEGLRWIPDPQGGPNFAVFLDLHVVQRLEEIGTEPFAILDRIP